MAPRQTLIASLLASACSVALAQSPGSVAEVHPSLPSWKCTSSQGCVQQNTSVVIDWEFRDIHVNGTTTSCKGGNDKSYTLAGNGINSSVCPNAATCAKNCVVEGINYASFGVSTSGNALTLRHYVRENNRLNYISPRVYLLGADGNYVMMSLLNQELSVDVDYSNVPCGENGALYLSEMDATGGRSSTNPGGANYGSGYCDAQCPTSVWRNGTLDTSRRGNCCNEMDILEANSQANAFTPHPCSNGNCDKNGCGYNAYASGQRNLWGPGKQVDTNKPFTVITQFVASGNTLTRIDRKYVQNGRTTNSPGSITNCGNGGMQAMGDALRRGMVLAMSIWNDASQTMSWLDSGNNGPCQNGQATPSYIESRYPDTRVVFSNIRWGDIGSTSK